MICNGSAAATTALLYSTGTQNTIFLLLLFIFLCFETSNCSWCQCRIFCTVWFRFYFVYFALLHPTAWIILQHVIILLHNLRWMLFIVALTFFFCLFVRTFVDWFTTVSVVVHKKNISRRNRNIRLLNAISRPRKKLHLMQTDEIERNLSP